MQKVLSSSNPTYMILISISESHPTWYECWYRFFYPLPPTCSKLLYLAHQWCQFVVDFFLIKQLISMWQTVAQAKKQRGEPVLEQQQPCQVWESPRWDFQNFFFVFFRPIGGKSLICRSHLRTPFTQSANNQQDQPCQLQQQVWDWGWRQRGWERGQGDKGLHPLLNQQVLYHYECLMEIIL